MTPEPVYSETMERLWSRLPEHYRLADAENDWTFKIYLSGMVDQLGAVNALADAISYTSPNDRGEPGDTSTLVDPLAAPVEWLDWLGQLVGVTLEASLTEMERRDAVAFASSGWRAGTKSAVADAAKTELIGTRYARVYDHSVYAPGDGGVWDVLIVTRTTETPDVTRVLDAVRRKGAKPAGVVLHHRAYEASWDTVGVTYPTWDAIEAAGSWNRLQEAGL